MAKRKPSAQERWARNQRRRDDKILHEYAIHCYQLARVAQAKEKCLPISAIVPTDGRRHSDVIKTSEATIRSWFYNLAGSSQARARAKIRMELGLDRRPGYAPPDAPKPLTLGAAKDALDATQGNLATIVNLCKRG